MTAENKRFYEGQTRARIAKAKQRKEVLEAVIGTVVFAVFSLAVIVIL